MTFVHDPGGNKSETGAPLTIDEVWVFVVVDDTDGSEGVAGFLGRDGVWMPLVAADQRRVASLLPIARHLAKTTHKTIRLVHFTNKDEIERIEP